MQTYVLGFAFSQNGDSVVLIKKNKPEWQKGKFNGVGGKVENMEAPNVAMSREFKEETGVSITYNSLCDPIQLPDRWMRFAKLIGDNYEMHCYRCFTDKIYDAETVEEERVIKVTVDYALSKMALIPSLKVLLPMALDTNFSYSEIRHAGKD